MIRGTTLIAAKAAPHPGANTLQPHNAGNASEDTKAFARSPRPRRSICCSAFRPTLSTGDSLWMRLQRYFRLNGLL